MSLLSFWKTPAPSDPDKKPAVIVSFDRNAVDVKADLTDYEGSDMMQLEDALMEALADTGAGEFEQNEFLQSTASIHYSAMDVYAAFRAMVPVLRRSVLGRKARVTLRPGPLGTVETPVSLDDSMLSMDAVRQEQA